MEWTSHVFCLWHSVYPTSPEHLCLLILVSSKWRIWAVIVHCPLLHPPEREFSTCDCAFWALWTSLLWEGTAGTHLSVLEKADVTPAGSGNVLIINNDGPDFQKDWRTVTGTLGPAGAAGPNFLARTLGFKFHDRANFCVRLESVSISAGYFCSVLTLRWALLFWHGIDVKHNRMRRRAGYNFRNLSGVTWYRGFPSVS